ncbi:hypothetical protein [Streptomyces sp. MJM1172]|uniref:hypothetical protein n=1 Tax=Streptomyces sp. MJM1172 TaxID=1703926 RepID=UPI0009405E40|nr:hypothetical protein [Streptomyces sp. MJM1172]
MYEPYGHHGRNGFPVQPDPHTFRQVPDPEEDIAAMHAAFGLSQQNGGWDPAEELACLLQGSMAAAQGETFDRVVFDDEGDTMRTTGLVGGPSDTVGMPRTHVSGGHRRTTTAKRSTAPLMRTGSFCTAVLVAIIAAVVSILSGLALCDALRHSATPHTAHEVVSWWPLLIYGPWMVGSLSILRAALHQRRAAHSWSIVLLFSLLATLLCVSQAPRTFAAQASATLPAIAALACFQQLVRTITLTRPPRQPTPRHRNSRTSPASKLHHRA